MATNPWYAYQNNGTMWQSYTSSTNVIYPTYLPSVTDQRYEHAVHADRKLTDREWLDLQVEDVCAMAAL